jgi:hypothetical protein
MKLTKTQLKQIIKEEVYSLINANNQEMEKVVSHVLSPNYVGYVVDNSFTKEEDDYGSTTYDFSLLVPKGDEMVNGAINPIEVEEFFEDEFGTKTYSGQAGGSYTKTYYNVQDKDTNHLSISIRHQIGYNI